MPKTKSPPPTSSQVKSQEKPLIIKFKIDKSKTIIGTLTFLLFTLSILGAYNFGRKQKQAPVKQTFPPTSTPTSFETLLPTTDETLNWKTFTNTNYGYTLKYPKNLRIIPRDNNEFEAVNFSEKEQAHGSFIPQGGFEIIVLRQDESQYPSLESYIKDLTKFDKVLSQKPTKIDNMPGLRVETVDDKPPPADRQKKIDSVIQKDQWYLNLALIYWDNEPQEAEFINLYNLLLSTFKFLPTKTSTSTENWKTYTNSEGDFSLKYPQNWALQGTVFFDQNNQKIAEFSPGKITPISQTSCNDYFSRVLNNGPELKTSTFTLTFEGGISTLVKQQEIEIGNQKWNLQVIKVGFEGGSPQWTGLWYPHEYCLEHGKNLFLITFYEKSLPSQNTDLFKLILSTFKFLD
jgi:hypothetical protein